MKERPGYDCVPVLDSTNFLVVMRDEPAQILSYFNWVARAPANTLDKKNHPLQFITTFERNISISLDELMVVGVFQ